MTAHELAAALDAAVAHISPTVDETHPMTGVYVSVRHDTLRHAARLLRELEAVRVAAANVLNDAYCPEGGHSYDCYGRATFKGICDCHMPALRTALGRVGGGT